MPSDEYPPIYPVNRQELVDRYLLHDDPAWRDGFCAALVTTYGREEMCEVRRIAAMNEAWRHMGVTVAEACRALVRAFRGTAAV